MIKVVKNPAEYKCTFLIDFLYVSTGTLPLSIFASKSVNFLAPVDLHVLLFRGADQRNLQILCATVLFTSAENLWIFTSFRLSFMYE